MTTTISTMDRFVAEVRAIRGHNMDARATVETLTPLLEGIVSQPDCLAPYGRGVSPERSFDIYTDDTLTIRCVVWQGTEAKSIALDRDDHISTFYGDSHHDIVDPRLA